MGGGGDVVGALGVSSLLDELGTDWTLSGVAWERSPIDPRPGPRSLEETRGGRPCGSAAVRSEGGTTSFDGVEFSESKMATHLGRPVLLLDITRGPAALAAGIAEAAGELGCDAVVLLDVGGDVLAHGSEPGLASPLCDAVVLAAAEAVPTEASLMAVRCARGERGTVEIRSGRRTVELTPLGALTFFFDPVAAANSAIPLATAVSPAASLEEAHEALMGMGVRTELDLERARAR